MKSKHIKKETAKRLREGFHTDLIELFEESIDLYTEKTFERGYESFFGDAHVHAYRIAQLLYKNFNTGGHTLAGETQDHAKVIEDYFNSLKK